MYFFVAVLPPFKPVIFKGLKKALILLVFVLILFFEKRDLYPGVFSLY